MSHYVHVRVLIAFNGMRVGDEGKAVYGKQLLSYARSGLIRILDTVEGADDGERETRPSGPEPSDQTGEPTGVGDSGPTGDEPGEDSDAG